MTPPVPSAEPQAFSKYRERGPYHWAALSRNVFRHDSYTATRFRLVIEAAALKPGEAVIDIGCGDGALTYLAWKRIPGGMITGVEPDEAGRSLAARMLRDRGVEIQLVEALARVENASQDVVICSEVIEHVRDPGGLLAEIKRILRPGGRAVLSTPVRLTEYPPDREHVREFFPSEFASLVEQHLRVVRHELACPIFGIELYHWRLPFLPWIGVTRLVMNVLSAWLGIYPLRNLSPFGRHHQLQVAVGVRD